MEEAQSKPLSVNEFAAHMNWSVTDVRWLLRQFRAGGGFVPGWQPEKHDGKKWSIHKLPPPPSYDYSEEEPVQLDDEPLEIGNDELAYYKKIIPVNLRRARLNEELPKTSWKMVGLWHLLATNYATGVNTFDADLYAYSPSWKDAVDAQPEGANKISASSVEPERLVEGERLLESICRAYIFAVLKQTPVRLEIDIDPTAENSAEVISPAEPWLLNDINYKSMFSDLLDCWLHEMLIGLNESQRPLRTFKQFDKCLYCLHDLAKPENRPKGITGHKPKTCSDQCKAKLAEFCNAGIAAIERSQKLGTCDAPGVIGDRLKELSILMSARAGVNRAQLDYDQAPALDTPEQLRRAQMLTKEIEACANVLRGQGLNIEANELDERLAAIIKTRRN